MSASDQSAHQLFLHFDRTNHVRLLMFTSEVTSARHLCPSNQKLQNGCRAKTCRYSCPFLYIFLFIYGKISVLKFIQQNGFMKAFTGTIFGKNSNVLETILVHYSNRNKSIESFQFFVLTSAPHGMEPYDLKGENDLGALSNEQQEKLNKYKVSTLACGISRSGPKHQIAQTRQI